jgi:hypothetical protein
VQESQEKVIQLKDDDPTALEHVIRHLYGFDIPQNTQSEWRFWLNLHVTADKYLVPKLSEVAGLNFRSIARKTKSIDDIIDILETIRIEMGHDIELVELAARLRKEHIGKLLSNDRYRAQLDSGGMDALWQQLDELNSQMLARTEMSYQLCPHHRLSVFRPPVAVPEDACYWSDEDHCTCCSIYHDGVGAGAGRNVYKDYAHDSDEDTMMEVRKAWIEQ